MTKTVDFTKEIVCSDENIKVIQVIPVNYENSSFTHLVVYELLDGTQNHCSVNFKGVPMWGSKAYVDQVSFINPEPKVVSSSYRNVYRSGAVSGLFLTREKADSLSTFNRAAILEFLLYDDNEEKVNYIEV